MIGVIVGYGIKTINLKTRSEQDISLQGHDRDTEVRDRWYKTKSLTLKTSSIVMDSKADTESADFSGVCPSPKPRYFCGRKWRFWVVCSRNDIYLSGGGVQATLLNIVAADRRHRLIGSYRRQEGWERANDTMVIGVVGSGRRWC